MPKTKCYKECEHDLSTNQHSEKVMKYKNNSGGSFPDVNMLQCPSSLKQVNFKMECFSSPPELL